MRKILSSLGMLISLTSVSHAVLVTLPDAQTLTQRLKAIGLDHFIQKTTIISELANQKKEARGVLMTVVFILCDYNERFNQPMMAEIMDMQKPQIIEVILQDFPDAIAELKQNNLI